jgi:hypothetical protein
MIIAFIGFLPNWRPFGPLLATTRPTRSSRATANSSSRRKFDQHASAIAAPSLRRTARSIPRDASSPPSGAHPETTMKKWVLAVSVAMALNLASLPAHARKSCEELKNEIAAKVEANGVKNYTLAIVAPESVGTEKVVGSCDGGTQRITYVRQSAPKPEAVAKADVTPAR